MILYTAKRVLITLPMLLLIGLISYGIVAMLPGDFFTKYKIWAALEGQDPKAWHDAQLTLRGLDKPWYVQFYYWAEGILLHGDFGYSFSSNRPVTGIIFGPALGWSMIIIGGGLLFAYLFGIPAGILSAAHYGRPMDVGLTILTFTVSSVPPQLLSVLFILAWSKWVNNLIIAPACWGLVKWTLVHSPLTWTKVGSHIIHLTPAWIIVGSPVFAFLARVLRMEIRDQLPKHYLRTARGKGFGERHVLTKHALRNALNPVVSMSGYVVNSAITWSILACAFLGLPGFGGMAIHAAKHQDQFLFTAILFFYGVLLAVGNLISDIALAVTDPRIRFD